MSGPLFPNSIYPVTQGNAYWGRYLGTNKADAGMSVAGGLASNATWRLRFQLPPTMPAGTMKLGMVSQCSAFGTLYYDVRWARCPVSAAPSSFVLNTEGDSLPIVWSSADAGRYIYTKTILDATAAVASDVVVMDLDFLASGNAQASPSIHRPFIIWETNSSEDPTYLLTEGGDNLASESNETILTGD